MLVQEMPIDFADQNAAILVSQPCRDRHEIKTRHHAHRAKVMAQIVEADPFQPRRFARDL